MNKELLGEFKDELVWAKWDEKSIKGLLDSVKKIFESEESYYGNLQDNTNDLNFYNLIYKVQDNDFVITKIMTGLWAIENVSTNETLRKVAREEKVKIAAEITKYSFNEIVYNKFKIYFDKYFKSEKEFGKLNTEEIKVIEDLQKVYQKKGMHLPKKDKKVLIGKINKITKLASKFDANCTKNYTKGVWFRKEELVGVPEDVINNYKFDDKKKKYFVSVVPSVMLPVMKFCTNTNTRKKIAEISQAGVGEPNNKLFREILKLRSDISKMLNFKTFSHMTMDTQMVSKPDEAIKFCKSLIANMKKQFLNDKKKLSTYLPKGEKLSYYNISFVENLAMRKELNVDQNEIKKYFEFQNTLDAMFGIWEKYFGVQIKFERNLNEVHEDVQLYSAYDKLTNLKIGTAIFDLFPRGGKYGHACVEQMQPRVKNESGEVYMPSTMMLCNFQKDKAGKTLLSVDDVSTLFHEGGHMLHVLVGKSNFTSMSPFSTAIDFVEIPSQFMENFLTDKVTSSEIARHVDTDESLNSDLIKKIKLIEDFMPAWSFTGHTTNALFDLELHNKNILKYANKKGEIKKLYEIFSKKYININSYKGRDWPSRFAHLVHGYESKYYSYIVSKVYARDAWGQFTKKYNYNGEAYKKFLSLAKTTNEQKNLEEYLGRVPSDKAFVNDVKR